MANPGIGYRTACDVLMEVSFHLLQPTVVAQITGQRPAGFGDGGYGDLGFGGGTYTVLTVSNVSAMYIGADVVVGWGLATAEIVQILSVDPTSNTITVLLVNVHNNGETILAPTFPTQEATDPIFTQSEMLSYLSRAQNEFLTAVPCNYERFFQTVNAGIIIQATPPTSVIISRIAASALNIPIQSMVRSGNIVTLSLSSPPPLAVNSTFMVADYNGNLSDKSFEGVFAVTGTNYSSGGTGFGAGGFGAGGFGGGGYSINYRQIGTDGNATGGYIQSMSRLYESTQEELVMGDRNWRANYVPYLQSWFEDRTGLYKWGVGGIPSTNFPVELLCAIRDTDSLGLLDGFLVPDVCLHAVKYLTMFYAWSKDGVMQNPQMADFCLKRYAQVVLATQRYIQAMKIGDQR